MVGQALDNIFCIPLVWIHPLALAIVEGMRIMQSIPALVIGTVSKAAHFIDSEKFLSTAVLAVDSIQVFQNIPVVRFHLDDGKGSVILHAVTARSVVCGMDTQSDISYTCHSDSSLHVVIPVYCSLLLLV